VASVELGFVASFGLFWVLDHYPVVCDIQVAWSEIMEGSDHVSRGCCETFLTQRGAGFTGKLGGVPFCPVYPGDVSFVQAGWQGVRNPCVWDAR